MPHKRSDVWRIPLELMVGISVGSGLPALSAEFESGAPVEGYSPRQRQDLGDCHRHDWRSNIDW